MTKSAWRITPEDDVAVVLEDVAQGEQVRCGSLLLTAGAAIPQGHKIACREIPAGEMVKKYGVAIGAALEEICPGSYVHTHNLLDITERLCETYREQYLKEGQSND